MSKQKQETPKADGWKTMDMEAYAKGNLELSITFLRMCLNTPEIFGGIVKLMENHRDQLIDVEKDSKELAKAEKQAK